MGRAASLRPQQSCPIEVIPNFVDTELFHPNAGEGKRLNTPTAVHVSNFRPVKRVPWLLQWHNEPSADFSAQ